MNPTTSGNGIAMIEYENLAKVNQPFFTQLQEEFKASLSGGWYILGEQVRAFEKEFAEYCGVKYCSGVASGLDALILSLKAFDFPAGSEVIMPSNTYIATILAALHAGLKPVLVEPDLRTYNIDPTRIEEAITTKTKAVVVVHLYGKCCAMDSIVSTCRKYHLRLIEDVAQAHGAEVKGRRAGSFGDFGAFSFYPTKNLGAIGDGGSLTCNESSLLEKVSMLRNYGSKVKYVNEVVGYNSRLDEIQAAFLRVKLRKLNDINEHKRRLAIIYFNSLKDDFVLPIVEDGYKDVYHIFNIRHPKRDDLRAYLLKHEIKTEVHYPIPPHQQKALDGMWPRLAFPISEEIHKTTLSLPISYFHSAEDILHVAETLNKF